MCRQRAFLVFCSLAAALSTGALPSAQVSASPASATYLYFIQGKKAGKSVVASTEEKGRLVFSSTSDVTSGEYSHQYSCRTEVDPKTLRTSLFHYEGVREGDSLSGDIRIGGASATGDFKLAGTKFSSKTQWTDPSFLFQNYVAEHMVIVARHLTASSQVIQRFTVLFPAEMLNASVISTLESEVELATRPKPTVCRKYTVSIHNAAPFDLYVDPKRNLLIYMDFPGTQTEVFLQDAFGDDPHTKYAARQTPGGGG